MLAVVISAALACSTADRPRDTVAIRDTARVVSDANTSRAATPADSVHLDSASPTNHDRRLTTSNVPTTSQPRPATRDPRPTTTDTPLTTHVTRPVDVDREIARAVAAWSRVRTLRATFEQVVTNPLTGSALTARGSMQQQKPNRLAITFTEPFGDRIVADGEYVWVYLQSATPGQVVRMRVTDVGAANTDLIGQFLNTPRSKYDASDAGSDRVGDRSAHALVLTAKRGESLPFIRAKVWVDDADALIRQFESVDASGVSRRVHILTMSPNAAVDASAFHFDVPAGVRVVDR